MKLIVDCALSHSTLAMPADSALAKLLAIANLKQLALPLEAVVSEQFGLPALPDYPIAAIAAYADGLDVGQAYWLRADPVHLLLQRDSLSLSEPMPVPVGRAHAEQMISSLNQHFSADGMKFMMGNSGAWYLRLEQAPDIQTSLPALALDRNIYPLMPTGAAASQWLSYLNEVQMILHGHAVNQARESVHEAAVNSVWISGGGRLMQPMAGAEPNMLVMAASPFYRGWAKLSGRKLAPLDMTYAQLLAQPCTEVRMTLSAQQLSDDIHFKYLYDALASGNIQQLAINLGCYEKTLLATLTPASRYKFWRKNKTISSYLL